MTKVEDKLNKYKEKLERETEEMINKEVERRMEIYNEKRKLAEQRATKRLKGESVQKESIEENCEGHPDGVEHTHDDGTVHTHPGGDKEHTHDEEVEEGKVYGGKGEQPWSAAQAGLGSNYDKKKDGRNAARKAKRDAAKAKKGKKDDQDEAFSLLPNVKDEDKAKKNPKGEGTLPPALQKAIDAKKKNKIKYT